MRHRVEDIKKIMTKCPNCKQKEYIMGTRCDKCGYDGTYHNPFPPNPIIR